MWRSFWAYLSSSAEIVLKAFDGQMWQPLVLLLLAVVGVLAGIGLRVRAFLFCGATFVMVAALGHGLACAASHRSSLAVVGLWHSDWRQLDRHVGLLRKEPADGARYVERLKSWEL